MTISHSGLLFWATLYICIIWWHINWRVA